jgi:hypothetical protein
MYTVTLYNRFNTDIIKTISNSSRILAENHFDVWLKDDACNGETLAMYDDEKCIKSIIITIMEHNNISKPMVSTSPSKGKLLDSHPCVDSRRGVKPNVNCVICKLPGHKYEFCLKFGDFCVKCGYEGHVSEHCENVLTMFLL